MTCLCVLYHVQRKIREADTIIQDTGMKLMDSAEQLMNTRLVQKNIISTIDTLNLCIPGKNHIAIIIIERVCTYMLYHGKHLWEPLHCKHNMLVIG